MSTELVALHGLNNSPEVWDGIVSALATPGVHWHRPMLPALDRVEAIAQALLNELPSRFSLVGFSFGGYVAAAMLEAAPHRIERFALLCSGTRADSDTQRVVRQRAIKALTAGGAAAHREMMAAQAALVMHPSRLQDPALQAIRDRMVAAYGPQRLIAHLEASIARPDRTAVLAAWPGVRWLIAAADDRVVTAELMRGVADAAPGTRFEVVPDSGHMLPIERPEAAAARLDAWLAAGA